MFNHISYWILSGPGAVRLVFFIARVNSKCEMDGLYSWWFLVVKSKCSLSLCLLFDILNLSCVTYAAAYNGEMISQSISCLIFPVLSIIPKTRHRVQAAPLFYFLSLLEYITCLGFHIYVAHKISPTLFSCLPLCSLCYRSTLQRAISSAMLWERWYSLVVLFFSIRVFLQSPFHHGKELLYGPPDVAGTEKSAALIMLSVILCHNSNILLLRYS